MAPYPEEIDVFTIPHSRMKQLVDVYSEKLTCTDFGDHIALESLLHDLHHTFCEFKSHEQIENRYIMRKLKKRLKSLSISDAAVCNCHSDNRLSDMLNLFQDGYSCSSKPVAERINFGIKLRDALQEFTGVFLPHMKEEEEVFQPMLMKYFEYEELKCLKERVMREHTKWCAFNVEQEKGSIEEGQSDLKHDETFSTQEKNIFSLPPEILTHIFSFLSPYEKLKCAEVCHDWYNISRSPSLWKELYPCYWAHGIWKDYNTNHEDIMQIFYPSNYSSEYISDEDADIDEQHSSCSSSDSESEHTNDLSIFAKESVFMSALIKQLLPKVGSGVQKIVLTSCRGLSSTLLREMLIQCPNIVYLDVSYTSIADSAFKGLKEYGACRHLQYLDLSGCAGITDLGLYRLGDSMLSSPPLLPDGSSDLREVYLENCNRMENFCVCSQSFCYEIEDSGYLIPRDRRYMLSDYDNCLCSSLCAWKKNGFMCHLARRLERCPYMSSCTYSMKTDISRAASEILRTNDSQPNCNSRDSPVCTVVESADGEVNTSLRYLNISGCWEVTDDGLRCLVEAGLFSQLEFLDVSGCWQLTGPELCYFVNFAPLLAPENIYYCNQIEDGPYPDTANGCQNLENTHRVCCCNRT